MKFILTRDVTPEECDWLKRTYVKGEKVFKYTGCTYGCISPKGTACSTDGEIPSFELPNNALKVTE
jgi:hypothetical protein